MDYFIVSWRSSFL